MSFAAALHRLRALAQRDRLESDLDRELQFHLEMQIAEFVRRGMPPAAARREALKLFGGVERVKEDVRDRWISRHLDALMQDVRVGLRSLRRTPAYFAAVVLAFALGIGATTSAFSMVYGVLMQPLPYAHGGRLALLEQHASAAGLGDVGLSSIEMADYRSGTHTIDALVEYHTMWFNVLGGPEPERLRVGVVSADYFDVLGVQPILGRLFTHKDEMETGGAIVLLTNEYWRRAFNADPAVLGRMLTLNDRPHRVMGVLPVLPAFPGANDVYMPTSACPFRSAPRMETSRGERMATAIVRLRPDASLKAAQQDVAAFGASMAAAHPDDYPPTAGFHAELKPLTPAVTGETRALGLLSVIVVIVLLIVCANVTSLTLARFFRRSREVEMRARLGATRARLARQFATESALLGIIGGGIGLAAAAASLSALRQIAERFSPRAAEIGLQPAVFWFALAATTLAVAVSGIVPATVIGAPRRIAVADDGGVNTRRAMKARRLLLFGQVAATVVLLLGAGVMIRSLARLEHVDPGFRSDHIVAVQIGLDWTKYADDNAARAVVDAYLANVARVPGVVDAAVSGGTPPFVQESLLNNIYIEGSPVSTPTLSPPATTSIVTPDYFRVMNIPIVAGRGFTARDGLEHHQVAIISAGMAARYWPGRSALGARFTQDDGEVWFQVVGIAADVRQQLDRAAADDFYVPFNTNPWRAVTMLVRTDGDPRALRPGVRHAVRSVDPDQPISQAQTLDEVKSGALASPRLVAWLLAVCGLVALAIAITGVGGLLAFSVSQRAHEFGIRIVLGASRRRLGSMVLREGLAPVIAGLACGLTVALAVLPITAHGLYETSPTDPLTFLAVGALVLATSAAVCLLPARRAAMHNPIEVLRDV